MLPLAMHDKNWVTPRYNCPLLHPQWQSYHTHASSQLYRNTTHHTPSASCALNNSNNSKRRITCTHTIIMHPTTLTRNPHTATSGRPQQRPALNYASCLQPSAPAASSPSSQSQAPPLPCSAAAAQPYHRARSCSAGALGRSLFGGTFRRRSLRGRGGGCRGGLGAQSEKCSSW